MLKKFLTLNMICLFVIMFASCDDEINDPKEDAREVAKTYLQHISPEMAKVRDYVPPYAVAAHRGSVYWTPEETEAAYRWAREMGADYLECDLQCSKDGVILALHDTDLTRTTNIDALYHGTVPATRVNYYESIGYTHEEALAKYEDDKKSFIANIPAYYMYSELMALDAGSYYNNDHQKTARSTYSSIHQYISSLEDLVAYSKGKKLVRDPQNSGERVYTMGTKTGETVKTMSGVSDKIKYNFQYEDDDITNGNQPGIYIEFKEPWLNPSGFVQMVYDELDRLGMNIITTPAVDGNTWYKDGKVNVGNSNGKVILQTFSLQSLVEVGEIFKGLVPMDFLLWKGTGATDLTYDDPAGYASFINLAIKNKAHIIGPCIAGAPNNYPELNKPWMDYLIEKSGLLNHPYSFDSMDQMKIYSGDYNYGIEDEDLFNAPYFDGVFTNRSDMTLQYFIDKGYRVAPAPMTVPDPMELLDKLGYTE